MSTNMESSESKSMKALLEMARAMGAANELDKLLEMVVDYSMMLLDAERATLFLYDKEHDELFSRIAEGTGEIRISINSGIAGAAARNLEVINIPDAYKDKRFNPDVDKKTGYKTRSILTCPLTDYHNQLVGVLQILNKRQGSFGASDISLAEAFSAQAGVALHRAHLLEEYLEKKRLEVALQIAQEVQQKLLPQKAPHLPGFDIACWNRPCDAIGGDYCDFLMLSDNNLMMTLGDVTGHGIGPALISCATRAMLRALSSVNDNIEDVMQLVNRLISADLSQSHFVTAFTAVLCSDTGQLNYCSAGQGPLLWLHASDGQVDILGANGIPVGIMEDMGPLPQQSNVMAVGDIFAVLTDGFYEWARKDKELFGTQRVVELIQANRHNSADQILDAIRTAVENFADTPQADDLTAIIIKKT